MLKTLSAKEPLGSGTLMTPTVSYAAPEFVHLTACLTFRVKMLPWNQQQQQQQQHNNSNNKNKNNNNNNNNNQQQPTKNNKSH